VRSFPLLATAKYMLFDDFSRYPDASILSGKEPRYGPMWLTTGTPPTTSGGFAVSGGGTGYLYTNLQTAPQMMGCKLAWNGGVDMTQIPMTMALSSQPPGVLNIKNLVHFNFGPTQFNFGLFDGAGTFRPIFSGGWTVAMNNTGTLYDIQMGVYGPTFMVIGPSGETFSVTEPDIAVNWGAMAFWEPLAAADGLATRLRQAYVRLAANLPRVWDKFSSTDKTSTITISNNNLTATCNSATVEPQVRSIATRPLGASKVHVEFTITHASAATENMALGIASRAEHTFSNYLGNSENRSIGIWPKTANTNVYLNAVATNLGSMGGTSGAVYAMEVDFSAQKIWFKNVTAATGWNNDIIANQNPATATGGISFATMGGSPFCICVEVQALNDAVTINTGATAFATTPSTGFVPWL